ncbi:MAG: tautomerase family protein [Desulfobacterales bacterium]|nr:tautomerase family protein [Desulfobacterales bacterium]
MPHVSVKLYPGRSRTELEQLAADITRAVVTHTGCAERSVSIAVEEVLPEEWTQEVYIPEILEKADQLLKKPGYDPLA